MFVSWSATSLPSGLPERFALIVEALCRVVAAEGAKKPSAAPLVGLVWRYLRRTIMRFAALVVRVRAGDLPAAPPARRRPAPRRSAPSSRLRLPRGFGWLFWFVPYEAASNASQMRHLLADPEMAALLADVPQARRLLRPLCHMLGIEPAALGPASSSPSRTVHPARPPSPPPPPSPDAGDIPAELIVIPGSGSLLRG